MSLMDAATGLFNDTSKKEVPKKVKKSTISEKKIKTETEHTPVVVSPDGIESNRNESLSPLKIKHKAQTIEIENLEVERFDHDDVKIEEESDTLTNRKPHYERNKVYDNYTAFGALIPDYQIDMLNDIAKTAMRSRKIFNRSNDAERITGNTVLRALLSRFSTWHEQVDLTNIQTQYDLEKEIERAIMKRD